MIFNLNLWDNEGKGAQRRENSDRFHVISCNKSSRCLSRVNYTWTELMNLDRNTMRMVLYNHVSHLPLHQKQGGRGLISVKVFGRLEELSLLSYNYLHQRKERLLKAACKRRNGSEMEVRADYKKRKRKERETCC